MIDNLFGGDDEDAADGVDDEEIGGLFDDPGDGGLEPDGDDLSGDGGEDLLGGGDGDLGGEDDLAGGGGGTGASNGEVSKRLDELENEVDSLSSTVNTVRSENEQLSGSIDDVEENIRKLLEVYEMVTRGVNPFVNENEFGDAFGGGGGGDGGSMALFGGDEERKAETDDLDESVANADADDFFEDDLEDEAVEAVEDDDGVFEDDADDDGGDDGDGAEEFEESFDDVEDFDEAEGLDDDGGDDDGDDDDGGKSFEDLKSKYETGTDPDPTPGGDTPDADAPDDSEPAGAAVEGRDRAVVEGDKPYLREVPGGYAADVVVLDWLEFLVDEAGVDGAARTVAYYEAIGWVSEAAAEHLQTYLRGFGDDVVEDPEPRSWLTVSHHETSLRFISRIDDPSMGLVAFDDRLDRGWPAARPPDDRRGGLATGEAGGHRGGVDPTVASGPELESDGGHRTPEEGRDRTPDVGGSSVYEPAATRRRRGRYGDGDGGEHTCEVGYGGFCWNHEGR